MPTSQQFHTNLASVRPKANARLILVALIVFCCIFMVSYASRLTKKAALEAEAAHWEERIEQAKQHRLVLAAERDYVGSDAYIEKKARNELGMAQQGDSLIIVVASTPTPVVASQTDMTSEGTKAETPNWQRWFSLFMPETTSTKP